MLLTATISIFLSDAKCGPVCRAQICAHSGVEPSRSAKAFLQVGQKLRKNFEFFTISRLYVHISQKLLKIEEYKQRREKSFISPLSNCRMCLDSSVTGFYRVSQKVSDVIPVLQLTPIATQPTAVSVFLSVAKCGGLQSHMYGTDLRTFWHRAIHFGEGVSTGWTKSSTKIRIFVTISSL